MPFSGVDGKCTLAITVLLLMGAAGNPQQIGGPSSGVTLAVLIQDQSGQSLSAIEKVSLRITSSREQLEVVSVSPASAHPLAIGLLFDRSGSSRGWFEGKDADVELRMARQFLTSCTKERDQFFLSIFVKDQYASTPFSSDKRALDEWFAQVEEHKPYGSSLLYESVYEAAAKLETAPTQHRVLVVITDGVDNNSKYSLRGTVDKVLRA